MAQRRPTTKDNKRESKATKNSNENTASFKQWMKRIVLSLLFIGIAGLITGIGLFTYYASTAPELDEELLKYPLSSEFYDVNGDMFAKLGAENRSFVAYADIPKEMIDAIIATEDVRFFDHFGLDIWRLGGAVIANFRDGYGAQGASTITQQVVKNSFLKNEKKLKRKAQEAWLAVKLEREYSKEEIFEMYFNRVLMSGAVYGFGTAADHFYGKELTDLTLGEMAQLAGMPQSPNNYNPYNYPEKAQKRRDIVLSLMVQHEKITQTEADAAKQINVADTVLSAENRITNNGTKYPAFLSVVIDELRENGDYDLVSEGIKVYTTLDPAAQGIVEKVMNNDANFPTDTIQSGVAVIDTTTGAIRAVGGGRNYGTDLLWNRSIDVDERSPGSAAKPLVSYGPAIENLKWSTGHTTVDEKITYPNTSQVITNWDGKYNGTMTIREALYTSRNVPAVQTLIEVGNDKSKAFLSNVGIKMKNIYPSSALGSEVHISPVQMAASYAAFGNNGVYTDGHAITKIVYRDGVTSTNYTPKSTVAMEDYTAYMVTDILRDTLSNLPGASAGAANVSGVDIAGKTGTSNYSSEDFTKHDLPKSAVPDAWFAGYTASYSIAIWSGYDDYKTPITTWPERRLSQTLFKSIMTDLAQYKKQGTFTKPSSVVEATIEVGTSPLQLASGFTPDNLKRTELFVRGTEPTSVSSKYEKPDVGSPTNLSAKYVQESQSIDLNWNYENPSASDDDADESSTVTFEIAMAIDGGAPTVIGTNTNTNYLVQAIEPGRTYTFTVTASIDGYTGDPVSTTILVAPIDEGFEDPGNESTDPNDIEDPNLPSTPPNQGGGNGPGDGNGPGNGNGPGGGNGPGNGNGPGGSTPPGNIEDGEEDEEDSNN